MRIADCVEPAKIRKNIRKVVLPAVLFGLMAVATAGCDNLSAEVTPVVMFPTRIPPGTPLPTFASLDTPATAAGGPTPAITSIAGPTITPRVTPTFRFINPTAVRSTVQPTSNVPTAIPTLDENWNSLGAGAQWRRLTFRSSDNRDIGVVVVRLDPQTTTFKVIHNPGQSKLIQDWRLALPGALAIVNASFFDQSNNPIGLLAVDGNVTGRSIARSDTGMFQVRDSAPKVRSLFLEPYNNTERFDQAAQGFPVLMAGGQVAPGFNPDVATVSARRTVFAQDRNGRILFIVTPFAAVTLPDLARWLGVSGLNIDTAVNMDGGRSTCLYLKTGGPSEFTLNLAPVPVVVGVYAR